MSPYVRKITSSGTSSTTLGIVYATSMAIRSELRPAKRYADRLLLKHNGSVVVVLATDIDWIEAADNYVKVHARNGRYMVRESIKSMESKLDPSDFARVHRSAIVNLARVRDQRVSNVAGRRHVSLET
mgnify:CR=1 FL=1